MAVGREQSSSATAIISFDKAAMMIEISASALYRFIRRMLQRACTSSKSGGR